MAKYAIKRIFLGLLTLFIVATLTFFLMNAVPGAPSWRKNPSALRRRRLWRQSTTWISPSWSDTGFT